MNSCRMGVMLALALVGLSCTGATDVSYKSKAQAMTQMTEAEAVRKVSERYALLFGNLRITNPIDGKPEALPKLDVGDFSVTGSDEASFTVRHDPLSGPVIEAKVGKANGLVQFEPIDLAVE